MCGHSLFTRLYREPSALMANQALTRNKPLCMFSRNDESCSMHTADANSEQVICPALVFVFLNCPSSFCRWCHRSPLRSWLPHIIIVIVIGRHKSIEEEHLQAGGDGGRNTLIGYCKYKFARDFGPTNAYNYHGYQNKQPKLRRIM